MNSKNLIIAAVFFAIGFAIGYWQTGGFESNRVVDDETQVILESVQPNDVVASPLVVEGMAVGPWYFEATFGIEVRDGNAGVLGQGYAEAQSDWMTEDFVSFVGTVSFNPGSATSGWLVLIKANPSGEPQYDDEIAIPVQF